MLYAVQINGRTLVLRRDRSTASTDLCTLRAKHYAETGQFLAGSVVKVPA